MFNETLINRFMKISKIEDMQKAEKAINNQAKYLKINKSILLKSYVTIEREQKAEAEEKAMALKAQSKNILIQKYKDEIIELYTKQNYGYLKISKAMKINHAVKISKSAIENFIKQNNLQKEAKNG